MDSFICKRDRTHVMGSNVGHVTPLTSVGVFVAATPGGEDGDDADEDDEGEKADGDGDLYEAMDPGTARGGVCNTRGRVRVGVCVSV